MGKDKLKRFEENKTFGNVFEPIGGFPPPDLDIKGKWRDVFFKNNHPIVLELGCGRGEYTIQLAKKFPGKNFIGMDRKGARMWRGAKTAVTDGMKNVAFVRNEIQFLHTIFSKDEVDEIWITFPDPHPPEGKKHRRLTAVRFINYYLQILKPGADIHLKTDFEPLYQFTKEVVQAENYELISATNDLYKSDLLNDELEIKTTYEEIFLKQGKKICYLNFRIQ